LDIASIQFFFKVLCGREKEEEGVMGDGGAALDGEEEEEALEGMEEDALDEDGDALEDMKRWWCGRWCGTRCTGAASVLQAGSAPPTRAGAPLRE